MRFAAIDIGSNSVHLLIADLKPNGQFKVVQRIRKMIRLGLHSFSTGRLSDEAIERTVQVMVRFRRVVDARRVERVRAVATSAVRGAANRAEVIARIRREAGIEVRVISGREEADLTYRAARHALGLETGCHLLIDLGGGSLELVLVKNGRKVWVKSARLGAARLMERFLGDDPPSPAQRKQLENHLRGEIGAQMRSARAAGVMQAIGTSGTLNLIVTMACAARGKKPRRVHGVAAPAGGVIRLCRKILAANESTRKALPGMNRKRIDQVPAAAMIAQFVLRESGAARLLACAWGLRQGLLLELARELSAGPRSG
jgi:exopolyphosphatase/guanosine-5'-triphosphate,3'-diphosphate pyrophosphatase